MRIVSIVTLITPSGEYGGPVRVALNQAASLMASGHDVTVAAGTRGFGGVVPRELDGVRVELFPVRRLIPRSGFAGLASPGLHRWLRHVARSADVVHVHAARDLVTLPAANWLRRSGIPYVLQTHGMIDASANPLSIPLDAMLTRPVLRGAKAVFFLTDRERDDLTGVGGGELALHHLPNGVPIAPSVSAPTVQREVLYLARLAPRKRPTVFVEMARRLEERFPDVRFRLVGPDEGEGSRVQAAIDAVGREGRIAWEGPLAPDATGQRLAQASIFVLPSVDEPYPMSVLEAMAAGIPVVVTDSCGLAEAVRASGSGLVVDDSVDALTDAVASLLSDPERTARLGEAARRASIDRFGMPAITAVLEETYRR